ncbi:hypothetical protein B5C34_05400 [Pacificimonas flava]|uniref:Uncharacterized protein n=2 Tax=Pacificimonas TaxID=1960290 RepID=A0A219B5A7_9SPHN|nr:MULTISPECIES: hypothetical protein [Pacificimonas]MBZ6377344.1 hypothetical protein [Pacificimonas aurantium]OWV32948.1 hypothetical protein B5C34_05400 [Pacificimonas flava]
MDLVAVGAGLWVVTHELLLLAAIGILVFAADELFVDLLFFSSLVRRSLRLPRASRGYTARDLPRKRGGRFAILCDRSLIGGGRDMVGFGGTKWDGMAVSRRFPAC